MYMSTGRSLKERFAENKPIFSVEFFPPKDEAGGKRMLQTAAQFEEHQPCLLYTSPSPRDVEEPRMPSSA